MSDDDLRKKAEQNADAAIELARQIKIMLGNHPARMWNSVLADLLAFYLARHVLPNGEDDPVALAKTRQTLLKLHLQLVTKLIPVNEELLKTVGCEPIEDVKLPIDEKSPPKARQH